MTIAEFFAQIKFKLDGSEELKQTEEILKSMATSTKATVAAIAQLNGMKITPPTVAPVPPALPGQQPSQPPTLPGTNQYATPAGPPVAAFNTYQQAIQAATKAKAALITNLKSVKEAATAGAVAIGAMTAALAAMTVTASKTSKELRNFGTSTGLSVTEMQQWSAQAAILGANGEEMVQTVKGIQSAMAQVALGEGDIAPFQFFGIPPDVEAGAFAFLEKLRQRIQQVRKDPGSLAIVREMAGRVGVGDDIFASLLRQRKALDESLLLTKKQVEGIDDMRQAWAEAAVALGAFKDKMVSACAGPLRIAGRVLSVVVTQMAKFADWLDKGSPLANAFKSVLLVAIVSIVALGATLALVAGGLALVISAFTLWTKALIIFTPAAWSAIAPIIAATWEIIAFAAAIAGAVLIIDDLWTGLRGGDSVLMDAGNGWIKYGMGIFYALKIISQLVDAFAWVKEKASELYGWIEDAPERATVENIFAGQ